MLRKVVKHGPATLTVSLPANWATRWNVKAGCEVDLKIIENRIIVSTETIQDFGSATVDVSDLDRTTIILLLRNLYRRGHTQIIMRYKNNVAHHIRTGQDVPIADIIHEETGRLIGMEVVEEKPTSSTIMEMTEASSEKFGMCYAKAFHLTEFSAATLQSAVEKNDLELYVSLEDIHDNVAKFVSYCIRLLNQQRATQVTDISQHYHILTSLDLIQDVIKYFMRDVIKDKHVFDVSSRHLMKDLSRLIRSFCAKSRSLDPSSISEYQRLSGVFKKRSAEVMSVNRKDAPYLGYLLSLLEIMRMVIETRLSMIPNGKHLA